jgi:hypothetical protein
MKLAIKHDAGGDGFDSAFAEAAKAGQLEAMQYLEEAGADDYQWAIDSAAERGQRGAIRWLIEGKRLIDLNEALYFAAFGNHVKTMRLLVENGATNFFVPIDRLLPSERMKALLTKVMISHLNPKARQRAGLAEPARRKSA